MVFFNTIGHFLSVNLLQVKITSEYTAMNRIVEASVQFFPSSVAPFICN